MVPAVGCRPRWAREPWMSWMSLLGTTAEGGGAGGVPAPPTGSAELALHLGDGGLPRISGGHVVDLHRQQCLDHGVLGNAVAGAEDLRRGILGGVGEDLTDGSAVEVLVGGVPDQLDTAGVGREVADVLEHGGLLLGVGEPGDQLGGLLDEIGRASCRGRATTVVGAGCVPN